MNFPRSTPSQPPARLSRRHFTQMLAASAAFSFSDALYAQAKTGPSMLLGVTDSFCGLDILRMRYTAARRPLDDLGGNALSWLIIRQKDFANKSLAEMRN